MKKAMLITVLCLGLGVAPAAADYPMPCGYGSDCTPGPNFVQVGITLLVAAYQYWFGS